MKKKSNKIFAISFAGVGEIALEIIFIITQMILESIKTDFRYFPCITVLNAFDIGQPVAYAYYILLCSINICKFCYYLFLLNHISFIFSLMRLSRNLSTIFRQLSGG